MGTPGLLPRLAIQNRDFATLVRLFALHSQPQFQYQGKFWFSTAVRDACANGFPEALEWLRNTANMEIPAGAIDLAASNGHVDVVRWLLEKHHSPSIRAMDQAATNGHFEVVQALHESGASCTTKALDGAAANGHLEIVKFLGTMRREGCTTAAVDQAALNGHVEVLEYLLHKSSVTNYGVYGAVTNGHLNVLQLLWDSRGPPWCREADLEAGMRLAALNCLRVGNVEMIKFVHNKVPHAFPRYALTQAVIDGDMLLVPVLYSLGRPEVDVVQAIKTAESLKDDTILMCFQSLREKHTHQASLTSY